MEIGAYKAGSSRRLHRALALWIIVVLAAGLLLTLYWPPHPASVVWLTPVEFSKTTHPPPPTVPARILGWLRQWVPRENRGLSPEFDFRLQAFRTAAIGGSISPSDLPVSTNSDGWQAWIVPAVDWSALHHSITSSPEAAYFRPMQIPGLRSGGGRGSVELIGEPPRHYVYDFKAEPVEQGLKLTVFYRSDDGGVTNVSLAFSAPVPVGGAVVLQKGDDGSAEGVTLLALDVLPRKPRFPEKNRAAEPDAAPEPPPAAAVRESSDPTNPKPQGEAPADGGGR